MLHKIVPSNNACLNPASETCRQASPDAYTRHEAGHGPALIATRASAQAMLMPWLPAPNCSSSSGVTGWQCYLPWILYLLSALAVLLGLVLVLVVAVAIRSYLKKKADLKVGP